MQLLWMLNKVCRDNPLHLVQRRVCALQRRWHRSRRRHRWRVFSNAAPALTVDTGTFVKNAACLWPGAADRRWLLAQDAPWAADLATARRAASQAAEGLFDILGSGLVSVRNSDGTYRWHEDIKTGYTYDANALYLDIPVCLNFDGPDIKVPWELSRFQWVFDFILADREDLGAVFLAQWHDWMTANPTARGVNWACTMDVALRALSWTAALAAWGARWDPMTRREMGEALVIHGHFIRDNLEWAPVARTNHYFSDIVGLAALGAVLSPHPEAAAWTRFAHRELEREVMREFASDGFNKECSTTYHRLMLELATIGYRACRIGGAPLSDACRSRLVAAFQAARALSDLAGQVPVIGDNDSGRVFSLRGRDDCHMAYLPSLGSLSLAAPELATSAPSLEAGLLCGPSQLSAYVPVRRTTAPEPPGVGLPQSGLFTLGDGTRTLVVRCGPLTYRRVGGHAHQDQLSVAVSVDGVPLLVDPGQYCYTPWPQMRNAFRSVSAHNTIMIDTAEQSPVFFPTRMSYSMIDQANPRCLAWEVTPTGSRFVGKHSGYRRLRGGGDHQREITYTAETGEWALTDRLACRGRHTYQWRWHLHPQATLTREPNGWRISRGTAALSLSPVTSFPCCRLEEGTHAPAYGTKLVQAVLVWELTTDGPLTVSYYLRAGRAA